ncbi:MAG: hypothetical protein QG613_355, partial [Pseudomonadota bacterium]|nr:hypothetical protein [Pseudomonadota bacterium]
MNIRSQIYLILTISFSKDYRYIYGLGVNYSPALFIPVQMHSLW